MPFEVEIIEHKEYVEAIVSGKYDLNAAVDKFDMVLMACLIKGLSKVLIDFRRSTGKIYAVQKILYTLQVLDKLILYFPSKGKQLQFAYVGKTPQVSSYEPGLEIVKREGIQAIVTDNLNEAFEWLGLNYS